MQNQSLIKSIFCDNFMAKTKNCFQVSSIFIILLFLKVKYQYNHSENYWWFSKWFSWLENENNFGDLNRIFGKTIKLGDILLKVLQIGTNFNIIHEPGQKSWVQGVKPLICGWKNGLWVNESGGQRAKHPARR